MRPKKDDYERKAFEPMRKRLKTLACTALIAAMCLTLFPTGQTAVAVAKTLTVSFQVTTYQNRARSALKLINQYRQKNGLDALVMLADLEKVAIQRAAELFVFFDHARPDLTDYDTADDGYARLKGCTAVGECIAAGYSKAEDAAADWLENAPDMLLDGDFTHAGLACVQVKGSYNEYYWALYLQGQADAAGLTKAASTAKAGATRSMKVEIAKGMYARADNSHKRFELRVADMNLKTKTSAQPTVYLYDRYDVQIGKCELADLTFKSGNTGVFTVLQDGTVKRKKNGTATLTVKADGLDAASCTVTIGGSGADGAVTAATIGDAQPELALKEYAKHVTLSAYVKGASGYVLYRAASKNGTYTKVDEQATTQRWTQKLAKEDISRTYYYKVRAYKNSNGRRVYSAYSDPVKVAP